MTNWLLIWMLVMVCLGLIAVGMSRTGRAYEYPFLAGVTFFGFVAPQLPGLADDPYLPEGAFVRAIAFTIACAGSCWLGWKAGGRPFASALHWTFDERRLTLVAAGLSVGGAFFYFQLGRLPAELRLSTTPSGIAVVYLFFAKFLVYGLGVAALCFARRPTVFLAAILLFDAALVLDRVQITGKRGELTQFAFAVVLAFWFQRRWAVPRAIMLAATLLAGFALNSASDYRDIAGQKGAPDWSEVARIDVVDNFTDLLRRGGPEMHNAIIRIDSVNRLQAFDLGLSHWNATIQENVPSQLIGGNSKELLMFSIQPQIEQGHARENGSTDTGMADAFASFSYLGIIKFFLVSYLLARIYFTAMRGWAFAQIIYIFSITPAMHVITHHTQWILSYWFHLGVLLVPVLLLARVPAPVASAASPPSAAVAFPPQARRAIAP